MLIVFQVPLADLRVFRSPGLRKDRPHWPTPDAGQEFVRYFGAVRDRDRKRDKRPLAWSDEKSYASASGAVKFAPFTGRQKRWSFVFRRLLCDGGALARFEVGFHVPMNRDVPEPVLDVIAALLDSLCTVRGVKKQGKLIHISKPLCNLYARATCVRTREARSTQGEVVTGRPTVLVQYEDYEIAEMPKTLDFQGEHLAFMKSAHGGVDLNFWFTSAEFADPRSTRLALLRLSAEHQVLKYVLRDVAAGNVKLGAVTAETERLQRYFQNANTTFSNQRFGVDQTDLIRLTELYEELSAVDELPLLRTQMEEVRPQIATKVLAIVDASSATPPAVAQSGPGFQWRGSIDEVEYQSFFAKGRTPVDVAWISDVTQKLCPAVCLIEIPAIHRKATGFLVGKDLLLTNYHVVEKFSGDDMQANMANMELRFTRTSAPERAFRLAANALVKGSPVAVHDYVLLRVAEDVAAALAVQPFVCDARFKPVKTQGIHIIQHPGGGPLKVSIDENGVTGVYADVGTVQYISSAQDGSSGSPCIDGEKRLVAIHHAEVQRSFGSAREGILLSAIYGEIQQYLT